jgi:hypothetical protein
VASSSAAAHGAPARRDLLMLGIETSCDDTAAAVVWVLCLLDFWVDFTCGPLRPLRWSRGATLRFLYWAASVLFVCPVAD